MNKKSVLIWSLYDFANSFVFISFLIYFSKWLVINQGLSDWLYNASYIIGSIGLLFLAPWLGSKADKLKKGQKYLALSTYGCFIFYGLAIVGAISGINILLILFFFALGNFFYQLSFAFYNPILNNISISTNQGRVSGVGFFANYLGQIGGVLVAIPFIAGTITIKSVDPLIAALIPGIIIFILLSLPLIYSKKLFLAPENKVSFQNEQPSQRGLLKALTRIPGVLYFMIAFFLFSDAVTTITNNFSIFTSNVFKASDAQISAITLAVIVFAGIGAWLWGIISDKIGSKKTLAVILISWVIIIPTVALLHSYSIYFIFAILAGSSIGGTYAVSRQLVISLVPARMLNYTFGIYAIAERAATLLGPLTWSIVLAFHGYRGAMLFMVVFQIVSVVLIARVPATNNKPQVIIS